MSQLLEKSKQSLESAKILQRSHYYSSTVNRSYYACFQFILYVLFDKLMKNKAEYDSDVKNHPGGTHTWASKLISIDLAKKANRDDYKWFQANLPLLKKKRMIADYEYDVIQQGDADGSIKTAESLIQILKTSFK